MNRNFVWIFIAAVVAYVLGIIAIETVPARAADGDAVALINGAPLSKQRLFDALIDAYGVDLMQQIIMVDLAQQECKRRNIPVTPAEIDAEFQDAVTTMAREAGLSGEDLNEKNKLETLKLVLTNKRMSMTEFRLGMERNAYLRKAAGADFDARIDEATMREEFARTYGERVLVRHIQIGVQNRSALNQVTEQLRNGVPFEEVARRFSENAATRDRQGEMDPFTFSDPNVPAALRETAFSLKPDEVSNPIQTDLFFHILKLVRRIPSESAKFADVKEQVRKTMRERVLRERMNQMMIDLYRKARIEVVDPKLRTAYEDFRREKGLNKSN